MKTIIKAATFASVAAIISMSSAYAAQDRTAAVEECFAQAQQEVPDASGEKSSAVQKARASVYSGCMKKKGLQP